MRTIQTRLFQYHSRTAILLACLAFAMALAACSGGDDKPAAPKATSTPKVETIDDVLHKMQVVFVGDYRTEEIKGKVNAVLALYQLPQTAENYKHLADVLVTMRQKQGPREMAIIDQMIRMYTPGVNLQLDSTAALATTALVLNIR